MGDTISLCIGGLNNDEDPIRYRIEVSTEHAKLPFRDFDFEILDYKITRFVQETKVLEL